MKHMLIPDTQVKPGDKLDHIEAAGQYAVEQKPDKIIHIGDHWDMPSLCSYDKGKKSFENRAYVKDIAAGNHAMDLFMKPIQEEQARQRRNKEKVWKPKLIFTLGNHEARIERAVENQRELDGLIGYDDFNLKAHGWEVHPFLDVVVENGVAYSHYFTSGVMGRPVSSARLMLNKKHMSCVMGHVQDRDIAFGRKADGTHMTGVFGGIFYQGDQPYLTPQTNLSWRGVWIFHNVRDGSFDEMPVEIDYLMRRFK